MECDIFFLKLQKAKSLPCSESLVMSYISATLLETQTFFSLDMHALLVVLCKTAFLSERPYSKAFLLLFVHRKMHSGMKTYGCELCGKSFLDSLRLRMHLLSHSGKETKAIQNPQPHTTVTELYLLYYCWGCL